MAILSNAKSYRQIASFIEKHIKTLKEEFALEWRRPPAYTTVRNIIKGVDSDELEACFRAYTQSILDSDESNNEISVAVDGKTLRGSFDHFEDKKAIHVLSFFDTKQEIILAHEKIDEKTNEIPVVQRLLKELELENVIYTLDALHCQKKLLM